MRGRLLAAGVAALVLGFMFRERLAAMALANRGALTQSRVELSAYELGGFQKLTLDQVRRSHDLTSAIADFDRALAHDPANRTARQRLTGIALSQKQYVRALDYASAAWDLGERDEITRILLVDALMANGRLREAAALITNPRTAGERLHGQAWYRYWIDGDAERAANVWAVAVRVNPDDQRAAAHLDIARARLAAGGSGTAGPR
jgi:tetratricopeptide (TPR) repeat protein